MTMMTTTLPPPTNNRRTHAGGDGIVDWMDVVEVRWDIIVRSYILSLVVLHHQVQCVCDISIIIFIGGWQCCVWVVLLLVLFVLFWWITLIWWYSWTLIPKMSFIYKSSQGTGICCCLKDARQWLRTTRIRPRWIFTDFPRWLINNIYLLLFLVYYNSM